jgi:hypothetical protein
MAAGWLDLLAAALGGGLIVKVLDILYEEFRQRSDRPWHALASPSLVIPVVGAVGPALYDFTTSLHWVR